MRHAVNHMSYAANLGLGRFHCHACASETLHKAGKCVHCGGSLHAPEKRKRVTWNKADEINLAIRNARKAGIKAMNRGH